MPWLRYIAVFVLGAASSLAVALPLAASRFRYPLPLTASHYRLQTVNSQLYRIDTRTGSTVYRGEILVDAKPPPGGMIPGKSYDAAWMFGGQVSQVTWLPVYEQ